MSSIPKLKVTFDADGTWLSPTLGLRITPTQYSCNGFATVPWRTRMNRARRQAMKSLLIGDLEAWTQANAEMRHLLKTQRASK